MNSFTVEQEKFLSSEGKVILHACPGSGKTTVVAQKTINYIKDWDRPHQGVAVLTFTNIASKEISNHINLMSSNTCDINNPHFLGTLDSFINKYIFLRFGYLLYDKKKRPIIVTQEISNNFKYWRRECYSNGCVTNINKFTRNLDGTVLKDGHPVTCIRKGSYNLPCEQFKKNMFMKNMAFQDEIPSLTITLLKKYPEIAQCVANRFPVVILDEAQDTSLEQMKILDLLCDAGLESIYIVGDPDQAIYEWRNANPDSFIDKMHNSEWEKIELTSNFRSSQLICNATCYFSSTLENFANTAKGKDADYQQKPILLLYDKGIPKENIIVKFEEICKTNDITISPKNVAVVTRSKINQEYCVENIWKTPITEFLANAAYERYCGNNKRAFEFSEKAVFDMVIKSIDLIDVSIESDVSKIMSYSEWKKAIIELMINFPSVDKPLGEWIKELQKTVSEFLDKNSLNIRGAKEIKDVIKIKSRDNKKPDFKDHSVKKYFETRNQGKYTRASVHGVKGESFEALLLLIENVRGNTLTSSFLAQGDISDEKMRIAYVAMTRPKKLLVVAMPKSSADISKRFSKDNWDYMYL